MRYLHSVKDQGIDKAFTEIEVKQRCFSNIVGRIVFVADTLPEGAVVYTVALVGSFNQVMILLNIGSENINGILSRSFHPFRRGVHSICGNISLAIKFKGIHHPWGDELSEYTGAVEHLFTIPSDIIRHLGELMINIPYINSIIIEYFSNFIGTTVL